ncbi:hypothetical protein C8R45DRAFT_1093006 [Mycena sanguinolenta]|nr:hypothetical protein C8R45DRAFT_1093006 [Mycena sanguinolenta]
MRADQFIVIKTYLVELKGRKARAAGTVVTLEGEVFVEAEWMHSFPVLVRSFTRRHWFAPAFVQVFTPRVCPGFRAMFCLF